MMSNMWPNTIGFKNKLSNYIEDAKSGEMSGEELKEKYWFRGTEKKKKKAGKTGSSFAVTDS